MARRRSIKRSRVKLGDNVTFQDLSPQVLDQVDDGILQVLRKEQPQLEARAIKEVPKDEHDLESSIDVLLDETKLELALGAGNQSNAEHAIHVEYGTEDTPPNPFVRRSIARERRGLLNEMKKVLGQVR